MVVSSWPRLSAARLVVGAVVGWREAAV